MSSHLGNVNLMLTQFSHAADSTADAGEWATDMLISNRLYRRAARAAGDSRLADFLTDLEPLLIELAFEAHKTSPTTRKRLQQEVDDGLLFKVRVMNKKLKQADDSI